MWVGVGVGGCVGVGVGEGEGGGWGVRFACEVCSCMCVKYVHVCVFVFMKCIPGHDEVLGLWINLTHLSFSWISTDLKAVQSFVKHRNVLHCKQAGNTDDIYVDR